MKAMWRGQVISSNLTARTVELDKQGDGHAA